MSGGEQEVFAGVREWEEVEGGVQEDIGQDQWNPETAEQSGRHDPGGLRKERLALKITAEDDSF